MSTEVDKGVDGARHLPAPPAEEAGGRGRIGRAAAVLGALAAGNVAFRLLVVGELEHTSLVFIGIPALLALVVLATGKPRTALGTVMKTITLALLMAAVLLGEAMVCVLFAAPLFYLVGGVTAAARDRAARKGAGGRTAIYGVLVLVLLPSGMEGVAPGLEFAREETVTATRVVEATPAEVRAALAAEPRFSRPLPAFFRLGFPTPVLAQGSGLRAGDRREVVFEHGHHPGTLVLEVARAEGQEVDFAAVFDDSYITHWLAWRGAEVRWREVAPGRTEVAWTLRYRRRLDPAWYFGPLERYAARLAAGYLIEALAAPREV